MPQFLTILPPIGSTTLIYAHRGAMGERPQNTMESFDLAWRAGVSGIELDVQCSRDNIPVVFHDDELSKLSNGQGRVRDYDLSDLLQLDVGSHFAPQYAHLRIPTLEQVLRARPRATFVNIELKTELPFNEVAQGSSPELTRQPNSSMEVEARRIASKTAQVILDITHGIPDLAQYLIVSSFHPVALEAFTQILPQIAIGILYCRTAQFNTQAMMSAIPHLALHLNAQEVTQEIVEKAHEQGKYVNCWTVNQPSEARRLIEWKVDGIMTNYPKRLLQAWAC